MFLEPTSAAVCVRARSARRDGGGGTTSLYTEATRFTPLGLDATVVWGYKDLRLRNNCRHPVAFTFELTFDQIVGCVRCRDALQPARLEIRRTDTGESRSVQVIRTQAGAPPEVVSSDTYRVAAPNV